MVNRFSLAVTPLKMTRVSPHGDQLRSAIGTGFFWSFKKNSYLITNWHNVTGLNPETNKLSSDWIPNRIEMKLFVFGQAMGNQSICKIVDHTFDLYDADDAPIWIEHEMGRAVDCVAVPLRLSEGVTLASHLNENDLDPRLSPEVGMWSGPRFTGQFG